jgi:hypothetical protein
VAVALLFVVWYFVETLPVRLGLTVLILLVLPVLAVVSFDRKGMRL